MLMPCVLLRVALSRQVGELHRCVGEVCALRRLETTRYDGALVGQSSEDHNGEDSGKEEGVGTFANLLGSLPPGLLRKAYAAVARTPVKDSLQHHKP